MNSDFFAPLEPYRRALGLRRQRIGISTAIEREEVDDSFPISRISDQTPVSAHVATSPHSVKSTGTPAGRVASVAATPSRALVEDSETALPPVAPRHSPTNVLYQPGDISQSADGVELSLKAPVPSSRYSGRATVSPTPKTSRAHERFSTGHQYSSTLVDTPVGAVNNVESIAKSSPQPDSNNAVHAPVTPSSLTLVPSSPATHPADAPVESRASAAPEQLTLGMADINSPGAGVGEVLTDEHTQLNDPHRESCSPVAKESTLGPKPTDEIPERGERLTESNTKVNPQPRPPKDEPTGGRNRKKKIKSQPVVYSDDETDNGNEDDGEVAKRDTVPKASPGKRRRTEGSDDEGDSAEPRAAVSPIPAKRSRSKFYDEADAVSYRINPTRGAKTRGQSRTTYQSLVNTIGSTLATDIRRPKDKPVWDDGEEPHDDGTGDAWLRRWSQMHHNGEFWPGFDPNHNDWKGLTPEDNPNNVDTDRYPLPITTTQRIPERFLKGIGFIEDQKTRRKEALNYDTMYEGAQWINDNIEAEITLARAKVQSKIEGNMAILEAFSDPSKEGSLSNKAIKALHGVASLANLKAIIEVGGLLFAQEEFKRLRCVFARMACNEVMASGVEDGKKWPPDLSPHDAMFEHARRVHTPPPDDVDGYDVIEMETPGPASQIDRFAMLSSDVKRFLEDTVDSISRKPGSTRVSPIRRQTLARRSEALVKSQATRRHLSTSIRRPGVGYVDAVASTSRSAGNVNGVASSFRQVDYFDDEIEMDTSSQPRASRMDEDPIEDDDVPMDSIMDEDEALDNGSPMKDVRGI